MPMSVGGGVKNIEDIRELLKVGADKVVINTAAIDNPGLIKQGAEKFGVQCIVVSIDVKRENDRWQVYSHCGNKPTGLNPVEHAKNMESMGAGEIILTSIDQDGTMQGYDVELTQAVATSVNIPVVASGGAGSYADMEEVLNKSHAASVAASSIFHYTEQTPKEAKAYLKEKGFSIRLQ